jgi:parallel beta-helix repeat protein
MARTQRPPIAFMSYVRFDDQHENGRLTEFRDRLSGEVHMQTGVEFPIFQDRNDIQWGQNWKERIIDSIDGATFLITIITPSFFVSAACRYELELFLKREKKLKRNDLVLPVYYVGSKLLDDEAARVKDKLAQEIAKRQFADWRELRFEPLTSPQVGKTMAQLAAQIRDALESAAPPQKSSTKRGATKKARVRPRKTNSASAQPAGEQASSPAQVTERGASGATTQSPSAKTEPPTLIVDPLHRGDHPTITEAIERANPGDRILVRPGLYQEGFVIDKPLEIIGDGEASEVVIQATGKATLLFKTTMGRVSNLTLRQTGGGKWNAVDIAQGRLELEGCDITSQSTACVAIHGGADPRLRRNRIHASNSSGIHIYKSSQGTLEDNDIFGNALAGIEIKEGGNPIVRRNRIHDGKQSGIFVHKNGQGTLEDNDIFGNAYSGVEIKTGGNPTLRFNRINKNLFQAIYIHEGGAGIVEDNDLRDNLTGAWHVSDDSKPNLKRARNQE